MRAVRAQKVLRGAKDVACRAPNDLLHRTASYVIVCEGVFHTFHNFYLMVVAGIIFVVIESVSIIREDMSSDEQVGGGR